MIALQFFIYEVEFVCVFSVSIFSNIFSLIQIIYGTMYKKCIRTQLFESVPKSHLIWNQTACVLLQFSSDITKALICTKNIRYSRYYLTHTLGDHLSQYCNNYSAFGTWIIKASLNFDSFFAIRNILNC